MVDGEECKITYGSIPVILLPREEAVEEGSSSYLYRERFPRVIRGKVYL